jgi:hypothetical protein
VPDAGSIPFRNRPFSNAAEVTQQRFYGGPVFLGITTVCFHRANGIIVDAVTFGDSLCRQGDVARGCIPAAVALVAFASIIWDDFCSLPAFLLTLYTQSTPTYELQIPNPIDAVAGGASGSKPSDVITQISTFGTSMQSFACLDGKS